MDQISLIILSGVSGSGKSTALNALEDLGYFCIDNLPTPLLQHFVDYLALVFEQQHNTQNYALQIDAKDQKAVTEVFQSIARLRELNIQLNLLYFDCQDEVIIRRYQETRRPHPFLLRGRNANTISEALQSEREVLATFRARADRVIDTTALTPHALRHAVESYVQVSPELEVVILSFGFKFGIPSDVDLVQDVRFLPNPYFVPELRELTGSDSRVSNYVMDSPEAQSFVELYSELLHFLIPHYQREGKRYLVIGIGCTGGKHRSVAIAEKLEGMLGDLGVTVSVRHRDNLR